MSRNFGTNDWMLHYQQIKSHFFIDTFFVMKKAGNTRGYSCMQIYVSVKGYVYVSAIKRVSKFPKALKLFAKEVGTPVTIISDLHKCHKLKEVKQFCLISAQHNNCLRAGHSGKIGKKCMLVGLRNFYVLSYGILRLLC